MSGDYELEDTLYLPFTTRAFATGIPTALVSGVVDIYEDVTATPIITAETLSVSLNGHGGFNMITVTATAASGFEAGKSYTAILDAGTVGGVSVVGEVVAHWTMEKSAAAQDLANGTDGLGAIKAQTAAIETDTQDLQTQVGTAGAGLSALPNQTMDITGNITGNLSGSVGSVTGHTNQTGDSFARLAAPAGPSVSADIAAIKAETALIVADTADMQPKIGSPAADVSADIAAVKAETALIVADTGTDGVLLAATATSAQLVDDVWDEVNTTGAHNVTNSTGKQLRDGTASLVISTGTCAATGQTVSNVRLAASESSVDDVYNHKRIVITAGTNIGFDAIVTDYDGTGKDCTITPALPGACDNTSEYELVAAITHAETQGGGYDGGAVWVSSSGSTGTGLYVDGTIDNPIDDGSFANAKTVADALGLRVFHLLPGANVTLAATYNNYEFIGAGGTVHFGGQDVGSSRFIGIAVDGTATASTRIVMRDCLIGVTTTTDLPAFAALGCQLADDITFNGAGTYTLDQCFSGVAGTATPSIDFESRASALNINLNLRHYSGGIELQNVGTGAGAPTDNVSLEGNGQLVINANCTAGTVAIRGNFTVTDNAGGALTLSDDARYDITQVNDQVVDALATDTYAEPAKGAPGATISLADKIGFLYKAWRNKSTQDATTYSLFNDDASTVDHDSTVSDNGTIATRGEMTDGP